MEIDPTHNGPLHVSGSLEIVSGTGATINRVTDAWLCRCGHSGNKPYCDGSHARVGFVSD
ncbi:MAG: CDGSH iron-sulfur domain-containing protein [Burkholderiaceae bacterium]|nr:CDGSH iron-sulfur domain-containing protein [Burkholderiaceae bacterium]